MQCRNQPRKTESHKALDGTDSESLCDAVGVAGRFAEERQKITALLDEGEIGMPGGTMNWTLVDRVQIAVGAACDQDDRHRAEAAERRLAHVHKALQVANAALVLHEPPDSRAVSDVFVALAAVECDCVDPKVMAIIDRELARIDAAALAGGENDGK